MVMISLYLHCGSIMVSETRTQVTSKGVVTKTTPTAILSVTKAQKESLINSFYKDVKPMIKRGGFIFDKSLYKWEFKNRPRELALFSWINFVSEDMTKKELSKMIDKTGLREFSIKEK